MKKISLHVLLGFLLCVSISAQTISKPTSTPTEPTPAQKTLIQEGARLHDQKRYDEAIKNYEQVLRECPTCVMAIYEMTLSLYYKKDFKRTLDSAYEGLKYKSAEIPLFLGIIANVYDDQGNPEKAVELYNRGIEILTGDKEYEPYLASIYYNLAVTNVRQKQTKEALGNLKKAVPLNFKYPSPNYLLSELFYGNNYKIPAMLAASRLLGLEINTQRAQRAALIVRNVLQGGVSQGATPNSINLNIDPNAPKDEGDYTSLDLILGISKVGGATTGADGKALTEEERFADQIENVIDFLEKEEKIKSTFSGQNYIPYMTEMKRQRHVKPFAYVVLYHTGNKAAQEWLRANNQQATNFMNWARNYRK